ncbi:MAG: ATP-binding cassette domain-containing protein [bacterium]|nr:ATP-binding cassette domain-containing protein [bacterium]
MHFKDCLIPEISEKTIEIDLRTGEKVMIVFPGDYSRDAFLDLIYGFKKPDQGDVLLNGKLYDYNEEKLKEMRRRIALVSIENNLISNLTVYENIILPLLGNKQLMHSDIDNLIKENSEKLDITRLWDQMPHNLSDLDKVKIDITRGLCQNAEIYIFNNLYERLSEKKSRLFFQEINKDLPLTISLSKSERGLEFCGRLIILDEEGVIYNGSTSKFGRRSKKDESAKE